MEHCTACDADFSSPNRVILGEALADRLVEGDADVHAPDSSLCLDVSDTSEAAMDSELSEAINSLREQLTPYDDSFVSEDGSDGSAETKPTYRAEYMRCATRHCISTTRNATNTATRNVHRSALRETSHHRKGASTTSR
eukprot:COSAG02_NODE_176_length_31159_cov_30.469833_26_plen_139_part_00